MYQAETAACNSACMSRQVGAAIVSKSGEPISIGRNDVPKPFGGLYTEDDQAVWDPEKKRMVDKDQRCFKWANPSGIGSCHNETRRKKILTNADAGVQTAIKKLNNLAAALQKAGVSDVNGEVNEAKNALSEVTTTLASDVDNLTEFSRSIHAEMEAILAVAREGRHSLVGATLYTNTYPCHNCARHIVAAGIAGVIYIHPYKKSLALDLHGDAITEDVDDKSRVIFRQYEGVAPGKYLKLFKHNEKRKKDGKLSSTKRKEALPILRIPLDSFADYEAKVIAELAVKEQNLNPVIAEG